MLRKYEAQHTDLCVDEALFDLQIKRVFRAGGSRGSGLSRKALVPVRQYRTRAVSRLPPPITFLRDTTLNARFFVEGDFDRKCQTKAGG
jgi:hypothetical protein